jgi:hypothetical protein
MMHPTDISSQPTVFKKGYSATRHARNGNFIHLLIHIRQLYKLYPELIYKLDY